MKINDAPSFEAAIEEKIKTLMPYIFASDLIIAGESRAAGQPNGKKAASPACGEELAVGLRYDDENMFAPIIMLMEQGIPLAALKEAASEEAVPVMENNALAGNLFSYGKLGEIIPELCCREVAAIIARIQKKTRPQAGSGKKLPAKLKRPIRLELGETLSVFLDGEDHSFLAEGLERIKKRLSRLLGYSLSPFGISVNQKLKGGEYRIVFRGIEAGRGILELGWYKTFDLGLGAREIRSAARAAAAALVSHVDGLVKKRAGELLGRDEVQAILDRAERRYPVVTGEVKSLLSLGSIRDILRGLIGENVSIRYMQVILETLADWGSYGPAPNEVIIEQIRQSLKRQICLDYTDDKQVLRVLTLETGLEQNFSDRAMFRDSSCQSSNLSPEEWLEAFSPAIRGMEEKGLKPVVLCSPVARSWVKEFTRMKFPELAVLSYIEIPPDINVEPVGEIALKDKGRRAGS